MEIQRMNLKLSKTQHQMLKELSDKQGFTMTGYIGHLIVKTYEQHNQHKTMLRMMEESKHNLSLMAENPELVKSLINQFGLKGE